MPRAPKKLVDRFFVMDKDSMNYLDKTNKFTCPTVYEDNVWSGATRKEADDLVTAQHLTNTLVLTVARFIDA